MVERPERTRLGGETVDGLDAFVRRRVGGHRRLLVVLHEAASNGVSPSIFMFHILLQTSSLDDVIPAVKAL